MSNSKTIYSLNRSHKSWSPWHKKLHLQLLGKPDLLPKGSSMLLAISGGQDSMTLLRLFLDLKRIYKWNIEVWHGDHSWHENSSEIAKELGEWCLKRNLIFHKNKARISQTKTEALARNWRYKNLVQTAKLISNKNTDNICEFIVTGHTASDKTETLLLNLARGTNLAGLCSLKESRLIEGNIKLIRPLLNFSREETEAFCKEMRLPIWIDPSNNNDKYSRNKIRNNILPVLERLYPGCSIRLSGLSERLNNYYKDQETLATISLEYLKDKKGINRPKLIKINSSTRNIILARWLKENGVPKITAKMLEEINQKVSKSNPPGMKNLSSGWKLFWNKESIHLIKENIAST